jgi:hypothetical protein
MCRTAQDGSRAGSARPEDNMEKVPRGRLRRWRPRHRKNREPARLAPGIRPAGSQATAGQTLPGETVAAAIQLAIGLLTASLDSPELEMQAADALIPPSAEGLADFMAGLHILSELLLCELHEATGEPSAAILQRLAILAEHPRGTPPTG